jgi:hypothetical protein
MPKKKQSTKEKIYYYENKYVEFIDQLGVHKGFNIHKCIH